MTRRRAARAAARARAHEPDRVLASSCSVALLAFPAAFGRYPVKLLQEILIWGIYAMSLDLLMGYAGMVSFGHSAFFGVGGYVAALALTRARRRAGLSARSSCPPPPPRSPPWSSASSRPGCAASTSSC